MPRIPHTTSGLADRATAAAAAAHALNPGGTTHPVDPRRAAHCRLLARTLSGVLDVDLAAVTVVDDPHREYGGWPGYLALVTEPDQTTWRFTSTPGINDVFLLLDACPGCGAEVPVAVIAELADLGRHLNRRPSQPRPPEFGCDPRHRPRCPHRHADT